MKIYLFLIGLLLFTQPLFAADPKDSRAKEIFAVAKKHYDNKEYQEALDSFEDLYRLTESPALYLNIAQCYRLMGRYEEAIVSYRRFVEENPKTPYKETIEAKVKEMEEALQKAKELAAKEVIETKSVFAPTSVPASQPILEATPKWLFSEEDMKKLESQMRSLESTTQDSIETALKRSSRVRLILPLGFALTGGALGTGAIVLRSSIEASGVTTKSTQRTLFMLAAGADISFAAAGVTLYRAAKKNANEESFYVGLQPANGGAIISIQVAQR